MRRVQSQLFHSPDVLRRWAAEGGPNMQSELVMGFVVYVDGYYYLFRTSEYYPPARCHVYRSSDPFDFGLGNDSKWVQTLRLSATEVVQLGDQWYISSVEDLKGGVMLARLKWM